MIVEIKVNVNPEVLTGIPLITTSPIVSPTTHDRHVQTEASCPVDHNINMEGGGSPTVLRFVLF